MPEQQQRLVALLILAGAAGLLLWLGRQPPPRPPPGSGFAAPSGPSDLGSTVPYSPNGARAGVAHAVPFYQNEETWELVRDPVTESLLKIIVHREAKVAN